MKVALVALGAAALLFTAAAAGSGGPAPTPSGLHAFIYRADEGVKPDHTYALMPAFAWNPVAGARMYDLELATSRSFTDATVLYRNEYQAPVASIQKTVPWMTGRPYALWVRVRVHAGSRTSGWSSPFGFNTAWQAVPQQEAAPQGLIRWTPVDGATGYDVWFINALGTSLHFTTLTNVADEREFWTLHPQLANGPIYWRVRADRIVTDASLPNGIAEATHGPYSPLYQTVVNGQTGSGRLTPIEAVSDKTSTPAVVQAHQLTPGFAWTGSTDALGHAATGLWRVYVFSDRQCVNPVLVGSIVGGDAWAPRDNDPEAMPADTDVLAQVQGGTFLGWGAQGKAFAADGEPLTPSESVTAQGAASSSSAGSTPGASSVTTITDRLVALGDNGWPQGRYWWTVVPVSIYVVPLPPASSSSSSSSSKPTKPVAQPIEYHDLALPQDECAAGQVWPFGMQSAPLTTTSQTPFASGLADNTRVVSAARKLPSFQELPVVTWKPAMSARTYEVQVSKTKYPWTAAHSITSVVTSAVLPLTRHDIGTWYYRVRGVNPLLVGPAQKLAWSKPVAIRISGDRFAIVK